MVESSTPLVMHVIHHLVTGGMENGLVNVINHMPPSTYRHVVVCVEDFSDFRQRIVRPEVEVVALHRSRIGAGRMRREIFGLCRKLRPAILHTRNLSGLDALLPARLAGVQRSVHGEHGWDIDDLHGDRWKPIVLRRLHSPLIDRYITVSKDLKRYLVERVGIRSSRVVQVCNGVDTDRFAPGLNEGLDGLPDSFRGDELVLVGTVGRIQPIKDQATLLRAFAELLWRQPELRSVARLVVVGGGPLLADLHALAGALGIEHQSWFPGAISDVPRVLRMLDIFVLPSLNEGISNTILEAMASQLPVIATAVGGTVELVPDGLAGSLFAPGDVAALATLLARYVDSTPLRRDHGRAARQVVVERHGLGAAVDTHRAIYDQLLADVQ